MVTVYKSFDSCPNNPTTREFNEALRSALCIPKFEIEASNISVEKDILKNNLLPVVFDTFEQGEFIRNTLNNFVTDKSIFLRGVKELTGLTVDDEGSLIRFCSPGITKRIDGYTAGGSYWINMLCFKDGKFKAIFFNKILKLKTMGDYDANTATESRCLDLEKDINFELKYELLKVRETKVDGHHVLMEFKAVKY